MKSVGPIKLLIASASLFVGMLSAHAVSDAPSETLAPPESFDSIADTAARSAAIFTEVGKVLTNPRCVNCHPAGDHPRQGDLARLHQPPVARGEDGFGLPAMRCPICHQKANFDPARQPGAPGWRLAPIEMGWEGKSLPRICAQSKDPERNGGRSLDDLVRHIETEHLVSWAWAPGFGRRPPPGTQGEAAALMAAWVTTGAVCPN